MILVGDKVIFVLETGRENMAKLMANLGVGAKMNEYDKDLVVEMIFLTPQFLF